MKKRIILLINIMLYTCFFIVYRQANEETQDEENVTQSIESIDDQPLEIERD